MGADVPGVRQLFEQALELASAAERSAFLDRACADQPQLRASVEALLQAHEDAGSFLAAPTIDCRPNAIMPLIAEAPGMVIGPYKLLQQIGEGGMGVVFMAEQSQPIRRTVALKIIKPGMDTRQVLARFEAERQALAMMDHPNIAKVFDAGATASGRPFFVMELVKGAPITDYCDREHLSIHQRLKLFVEVCHAVHHAHQKGIIHRDLKPSNVLVAEYDGRPVPKVIDFGVAKTTAQNLSDKTLFTEFGQLIGTFEYMSPEQARFNQLDVDTRSDIYSLGVLLYELLTGATPFGRQRLVDAALDEMLRIIREEDPPRPSTRLSTSDTLPSIAANRSLEPKRLPRLLHGELDWIVMKCLEKDRDRRYETANGFVSDLSHYLNDEPVLACPPSAIYRFGKLARRNKAALFVASLALMVLLLLVAGLAVSNRMIAAERDQKAQALTEKELAIALAAAQAHLTYFKDLLQYRHADITPSDIESMYREATRLSELAASVPHASLPTSEVAVRARIGHVQRDLAFAVRLAGRLDLSKEAFERSILTFEELKAHVPGDVDNWHFVADSHRQLGHIAEERGLPAEAELEYRNAITLHEERVKNLPTKKKFFAEQASAYYDLARLLIASGRRDEADSLIAQGVEINPVRGGQSDGLRTQIQLAVLLREAGELDQAFALYLEIYQLATAADLAVRCSMADGCSELARLLSSMARFEQSQQLYRQAIALRAPLDRDSSPVVRLAQSSDYNDVAFAIRPEHRGDEAEQFVRAALGLRQALVDDFPDNRDYQIHVVHSHLGLGHLTLDAGRTTDAHRSYDEAMRGLSKLSAQPAGTPQYEQLLRDALDQMVGAWQKANRRDNAMRARQMKRDRMAILAVEFPDNLNYQLELARDDRDTDNWEGALAQCATILARNPDLMEARNIRGDCWRRQGKLALAEEEFSNLIKLYPDRWESWNGRASVYLSRQEWESCAADYSRAIELAPEIHALWFHRGHAYFQLAQWDKAAADFTKVVEGWPDEPGGWYLRALAHAQLNQPDKALADLRQAIALGYSDIHQLQTESKLDPLRSRRDFEKLIAEVEDGAL